MPFSFVPGKLASAMKSMGPSTILNGAAHKRPTIQTQANGGLIGVMPFGDARQQAGRGSGLTIVYILQPFSDEL